MQQHQHAEVMDCGTFKAKEVICFWEDVTLEESEHKRFEYVVKIQFVT